MNKSLIIKIVVGSTMGLFCIGFKIANERIKKQRNEIFDKLQEVVNENRWLINDHVKSAQQMQILTLENKEQARFIKLLRDSKKGKRRKI